VKRVLITGASGFIGRHAVESLAAIGCEVHAVDLRVMPAPTNVIWHQIDLLDAKQVSNLAMAVRPTDLLHFAWYAEHGRFWSSPLNLDWVAASIQLFKSFVEAGGRRAVFAGSCAEYDWTGSEPLVEDKTPCKPGSFYGVCKNATRQVVQAYASEAKISFAWGRIFFLYGPDENPNRLIPSILHPLLEGKPARCLSGDHVRDLLHVHDVASAFVALLQSDVTGSVNIASGERIMLSEVSCRAARIVGREDLLTVDRQPGTPANPATILADTTRLRREVGWKPRYDLTSGLEQVVASMRRPHISKTP
jgi:nucleoside-diphosphate-sugar epimerase